MTKEISYTNKFKDFVFCRVNNVNSVNTKRQAMQKVLKDILIFQTSP